MQLRSTKIVSTGSYLPQRVLTNHDLEKMVDTSDEWVRTRTGIAQRHVAEPSEAASDLAYHASIRALEKAGMSADQLDMIIVATITPDMLFPATGCILQNRLGARTIPAFDMEAACSGFLYGLTVADQFIKTGMYDNILVVASEALSKIIDWTDRNTCVIFADGAGAAILGPSDSEHSILASHLGSDGGGADLVGVPGGGSRLPATAQSVQEGQHFMKMKGNELFKRAVKIMVEAGETALTKAQLDYSDIDLFIPHQANIRIIRAVTKRIHLPEEKVYINLQECGNMSAASIAVALDQAQEQGRIRNGNKILLTSFGGGLTWGSMVVQW